MSPNQYLEYVDILSRFKSDQSEQRQQMPLQMQLEEDKYQESPSKVDQLDSDGLRDINHGTQHGWLASQHETDNNSPLPTKEYKRNSFENKNHENIQDEKDLNESHLVKESDTHTEVTPYAFKRDYGSDNRRVIDEISSKDHSKIHETNSEDNSKIQEKVVSKPNKKINSNKPFYKSIIATTAAIIIQRFWRNYRSQKLNQGQHDGGTSILEVLKQKIQSNQPFIYEQQVVNSNPNTVQNNNENIMLNNISSELALKTPSKDINDSMSSLSQSSGYKEEVKDEHSKIEQNQELEEFLQQAKTERVLKPNEFYKDQHLTSNSQDVSLKEKHEKITKSGKKHSFEKWCLSNKHNKNKKKKKNVYENTIEMINDTDKNKERIKKLLATSKAKRPGIWSEYGNDSFRSLSSRSLRTHTQNASFNSFQ